MSEETKNNDYEKKHKLKQHLLQYFNNPAQIHYMKTYMFIDKNTDNIDAQFTLFPMTKSYKKYMSNLIKLTKVKNENYLQEIMSSNYDTIMSDEELKNELSKLSNITYDKQGHKPKFTELFDVEIDVANSCMIHNDKVMFHIGNLNFDEFKRELNDDPNSYHNINENLNKKGLPPFAKGTIPLDKYISLLAFDESKTIYKISTILKIRLGSDVQRMDYFINDKSIKQLFKDYGLYDIYENYSVSLTCCEIFMLLFLDEIYKIYENEPDAINLSYELLMSIIVQIQGIWGVISTQLQHDYFSEISNEINKINSLQNKIHDIFIQNSASHYDDTTYFVDMIKKYGYQRYTKLKISPNEVNAHFVTQTPIAIMHIPDDDPNASINYGTTDISVGNIFFSNLEFDYLKNTYQINNLMIHVDYKYYPPINDHSINDINPSKYQQIKETIGDNKSATTAGTLLALGALSAIPLALLLGGKHTSKRMRGGLCRNCSRRRKNKNKKNKYRQTFKRRLSKRRTSKRRTSNRKISKRKSI
jgi:hypothetical protein